MFVIQYRTLLIHEFKKRIREKAAANTRSNVVQFGPNLAAKRVVVNVPKTSMAFHT